MAALESTDELIQNLENIISKKMKQKRVVGFSLVLIDSAQVIWFKAFGYKHIDNKTLMTEKTNLETGSLTKPAFAYSVLKLCENGLLDLDTPLCKYLPEPYIKSELSDLITARMVLSHTTGLPNWRPKGNPLKIYFTPGTRFSYSGEGFQYLQKVVEHLTQRPLEEYMQETFFKPLDMTSSLVWSDDFDEDFAYGHDEKGKPSIGKFLTAGAAYSLRGTPTDYAKFLITLMKPPKKNEFFLSEHSIREMVTPVISVNDDFPMWDERWPKRVVNDIPNVYWGLGWGLQQLDNKFTFWHWGDNYPLYKAFTMGSLEEKKAIIMMSNCYYGSRVFLDVLKMVFGVNLPVKNYFDVFYPGYF
ncbi:MAG: serine hydrolase domain-containing protein [Promethearchaeota archaeon]